MAEATEAPGALKGTAGPEDGPDSVIIDNRTGLPDEQVREAVMSHWVESAAMQFGTPTNFQLFATGGGNALMRSPFTTPGNVLDEVRLARHVADTDDDVMAVIGQMVNTAYRDGMQNLHEDQSTLDLFDQVAFNMNLDLALKEMYREYIIAGQVNTLSLFTRSRLSFTPDGSEQRVQAQLSVPLVGILPAENIRVMSNDVFGTATLAYDEPSAARRQWLDEFFNPQTTPARREAMRRAEPVIAAVFTGTVEVPWNDTDMFTAGKTLYTLNPRMVHRTTMPKGSNAYPRPRMTANFALLEAKRLLNIMDYSLLQGGTNYIVVAKVGSDKHPGKQPEVDNLTDQVRAASRTGVLVGDHRVTVEIITPDLGELLNPAKRKLLGRKLVMALLCIPEQVTPDPGNEGARGEMTWAENTITSDRHDIKRHIERFVYSEVVQRNPSAFKKGPPNIWHQRVVLSGVKDFIDQVTKARDRGDIPRKWSVEVLGFPYEAGVAQRRRELARGDDEVMTPGSVPFSNNDPNQPPSDNPDGRPPGSSSDNGRPGAQRTADPAQRQRQLIPRRRGEPVRAHWDEARAETVRVGELTAAVLEQFPDHQLGRVTDPERQAIVSGEVARLGAVSIIPVNPEYETRELRAIRLSEGARMIVGQRVDGAVVARALAFREPQFDPERGEELAMRWGFVTSTLLADWKREEEATEPVTAEAVAGELASQARAAVGGIDMTALMGGLQQAVGQMIAEAVAQAVKEMPAPVVHVQAALPPAND